MNEIKLVIKNGRFAGKEYTLADGQLCLVGRAEDCDLRVPSNLEYRAVSRHHCLLDIDLPRVRVRDLGSRNGTFLNGRRVQPAAVPAPEGPAPFDPRFALEDGDVLNLGGTIFRVVIPTPTDGPTPVLERAPADSPESLVPDLEDAPAPAPAEPEVNPDKETFHAPLFA